MKIRPQTKLKNNQPPRKEPNHDRQSWTQQPAETKKVGGIEVEKLKSYIGRIENLEEEKAGIAADVRDVMAEAKANGFDAKTMRQILKLRKIKANERAEQEYLLDLYKRALGMHDSDEDGEE